LRLVYYPFVHLSQLGQHDIIYIVYVLNIIIYYQLSDTSNRYFKGLNIQWQEPLIRRAGTKQQSSAILLHAVEGPLNFLKNRAGVTNERSSSTLKTLFSTDTQLFQGSKIEQYPTDFKATKDLSLSSKHVTELEYQIAIDKCNDFKHQRRCKV